MNATFGVYKPRGPTSFEVVKKVRDLTGARKVGHAGTLDPLAEGVLVIAVGDATKSLNKVVAEEKEYAATVRLGMTSATDDEEGEKTTLAVSKIPTEGEVAAALEKLTGKVFQTPPVYSAVKVRGKEAYKYARQGARVQLQPREVFVKSIRLVRYRWPDVELVVTTGPGVYVRALARDLGTALKTGAYLAALKRTRVGNFTAEEAVPYENLEHYLEPISKSHPPARYEPISARPRSDDEGVPCGTPRRSRRRACGNWPYPIRVAAVVPPRLVAPQSRGHCHCLLVTPCGYGETACNADWRGF